MGTELVDITITCGVTEEQKKQLERLLPDWQAFHGRKGGYPFKNWTIENLMRHLIERGIEDCLKTSIREEEKYQKNKKGGRESE